MLAPIRISIIDDHEDVRQALVARLKAVPQVEVVADTGEAEAGLRMVQTLRPDVVLVDTKRGDGRGLEIVSWIALSGLGTRVFVLTSYPSDWEKWAVCRAGAQRYFLKDIDSAQLVSAIVTATASM